MLLGIMYSVHSTGRSEMGTLTNNMIDQQSALFFLLSWPIFPLNWKWGNFLDNKFVILLNFFLFKKQYI